SGNWFPYVVALTPNGQTAAVAGKPGQLDLVDLASERTTKLVHRAVGERRETISALGFSPDGTTLAGHTAWTLFLWDVAKGEKRATHTAQRGRALAGAPAVAFSPDKTLLVTSAGDETLALRDPASGEVRKLLRA